MIYLVKLLLQDLQNLIILINAKTFFYIHHKAYHTLHY